MIEKHKDGYYRCKVRQGEVYEDILKRYRPYITREALRQLYHAWHTQRNELMNQSVSAFVPKGRQYSLSTSLDSRVGIAAVIRNVGYDEAWRMFFRSFNLTYDADLSSYLKNGCEKDEETGKESDNRGNIQAIEEKARKASEGSTTRHSITEEGGHIRVRHRIQAC